MAGKRERKSGRMGHLLEAVCFLLVFLFLFQGVSRVLRGRPAVGSNAFFYEEPRQSLDVLFLGSSHMLNAVSPMQLWEEWGIPSGNLGVNGQVLPVTYYTLQEALRYQKPRVVVLDIYKVVQDSLIDSKGSLHAALDGMPLWSLPKYRSAFDLLPKGERAEFLLDIIVYHDRWKEVTREDFLLADTREKGAQTLFTVEQPYQGWEVLPEGKTAPPVQVEMDYLEKIIALCQKEDISLLLVAVPYTTPEKDDLNRQAVVNGMAAYATEKGLPYLNLMHETGEMGFDFSSDMADMYHVNWKGMEKVTALLGEYLVQNYDLTDRREDPAYADWNEDLLAYRAYLEEQLQALPDSKETTP